MAIKNTYKGKYTVDIRDQTGKRIQRSFLRLTEAKAFEAKYQKEKYENHLIKNNLKNYRYSIFQALEDFRLTKAGLRPKSVQKYNFIIKQLEFFCKGLEIKFIDEFSSDHATILYSILVKEKQISKGELKSIVKAKPKTINFYLNTTRSFFNQEVVKGHIIKNPMIHIKNLKVEKKKPDFYSEQELKKFFSQKINAAYRNAFLGFLFSGMRFSELANLTWEDIDFDSKLVFIRSKENFKTKTHNSERAIPMNKELFDLLTNLSASKVLSTYPFCSPNGNQLRERRTLEVCKKIAKEAGIKSNAYIHKFRHTFASLLLQKGVSIHSIKELLGHYSVVQTEIYAHHNSKYLHKEVSALDNLL